MRWWRSVPAYQELGRSRGTGHMSFLSLETPITAVTGAFEMPYSGSHCHHTEEREVGSAGHDEDYHRALCQHTSGLHSDGLHSCSYTQHALFKTQWLISVVVWHNSVLKPFGQRIKPCLCMKESILYSLSVIELWTVAVKLNGMCDSPLVVHN